MKTFEEFINEDKLVFAKQEFISERRREGVENQRSGYDNISELKNDIAIYKKMVPAINKIVKSAEKVEEILNNNNLKYEVEAYSHYGSNRFSDEGYVFCQLIISNSWDLKQDVRKEISKYSTNITSAGQVWFEEKI